MKSMVSNSERSMGKAEQKAQDVRAWLMIGAVFIATLLMVWVPLIYNALYHT
jgi:hypothetical protein